MGTGGLGEQGGDDVPTPGGTFDSIAAFSDSNQGALTFRKVSEVDGEDDHTYFDVLGSEEEPLTINAEVNFSDREIFVVPHGAHLILESGCRLNFKQNDEISEFRLPIIKVAGSLIIKEGAQINVEVVQSRIGIQVCGLGDVKLEGGQININMQDDSQKIRGKGIELRKGEEEEIDEDGNVIHPDTSNEGGSFRFRSGKINIGTLDFEDQYGIYLNTPDLGAGFGSNFTIEGDEHCEINIDYLDDFCRGISVNNGSFIITNSHDETKISINEVNGGTGIELQGKNTTESEGDFTLEFNGTKFSTNKLILFSKITNGGVGIVVNKFSRFTLKEGDSSKIEFESILANPSVGDGIVCDGQESEFIQETNSHIIIHKLNGNSTSNSVGLLLGNHASFTMGKQGNGADAVFEINECSNSQMIQLIGPNVRLVKHIAAVIKYNGVDDKTGAKGILCKDPGTTNILVENYGGKHTIDMSLVPVSDNNIENMYNPELNHLDNQKGLTPPWGDASPFDVSVQRYKVDPNAL